MTPEELDEEIIELAYMDRESFGALGKTHELLVKAANALREAWAENQRLRRDGGALINKLHADKLQLAQDGTLKQNRDLKCRLEAANKVIEAARFVKNSEPMSPAWGQLEDALEAYDAEEGT